MSFGHLLWHWVAFFVATFLVKDKSDHTREAQYSQIESDQVVLDQQSLGF